MKSGHFVLGCCVAFFSLAVSADDQETSAWTFIPSLSFQQKQLNFDQYYTDNPALPKNENGRKSTFRVNLPTVNLSLTGSYQKVYAALKYEQSLMEVPVEVDEIRPTASSAPDDAYYLNTPGHETRVKRQDVSLTIGANVWRGMNVFVGYMEGKTKLTPEPSCTLPPTPGYFCGVLNLAVDLENEHRGEYHQIYTEKGPYAGVSYGWQIAEAGTLSASFAYAKMDGRFRDNYVYSLGDKHFNFTGDSVGTSIGLTWTAPLGESSSYFIDARQQQYSMRGTDDGTPSTKFNTVKVKTDETMRGLTMGVQRYF